MDCDTCNWKMSSDGRCLRGQSPNSCSDYMMNPHLRRAMEQQESDHRESEERERKEKKRQEWLKSDEGKKWQAEENRKTEEARLEKERKEREEREERERKEREHQEWLASEEGQKWLAEEKEKEAKKKKNRRGVLIILSILFGWLGVDRFFAERIGLGILKLLTCGGFGLWWLIDVILAIIGKYKDSQGQYI